MKLDTAISPISHHLNEDGGGGHLLINCKQSGTDDCGATV